MVQEGIRQFLSRALAAPLAGRNHLCNFGRRHHEEQFCEFFEFGPVVQEEMSFNDISYLELRRPFCSAEWNHLSNFGRGYHEEQF